MTEDKLRTTIKATRENINFLNLLSHLYIRSKSINSYTLGGEQGCSRKRMLNNDTKIKILAKYFFQLEEVSEKSPFNF